MTSFQAAPVGSVDPQLVRRLQREAGALLGAEQRRRRESTDPNLRELAGDDERQYGRMMIQQVVRAYRASQVEAGQDPITSEAETQLLAAIEAKAFGAGSLQHLIDDPEIENIDINGCDRVFVTRAGDERGILVEPVAMTDQELIEQVQILAAHSGLTARPFDAANSQLDLRLPDGSRLSAIMGNSTRVSVSIRRHRHMKVRLGDLVGNGTMSSEVADFLAAAVKARMNIMVAGATNAGKTTLLRALAAEIDSGERIITIEKALELGLDHDPEAHPNVVVLEESLAGPEGAGAVTMAELLRRTLRMNPDRVIVGEVLGPEIVTMLNAMSQGNNGSLSTIHARSARTVFKRIATYARQAAEHLDMESSAMLTAAGLDLVVFMRTDDDGRRVREIVEVAGNDGAQVSAATLFVDTGDGVARRRPNIQVTDARAEALVRAGWSPPDDELGWV